MDKRVDIIDDVFMTYFFLVCFYIEVFITFSILLSPFLLPISLFIKNVPRINIEYKSPRFITTSSTSTSITRSI